MPSNATAARKAANCRSKTPKGRPSPRSRNSNGTRPALVASSPRRSPAANASRQAQKPSRNPSRTGNRSLIGRGKQDGRGDTEPDTPPDSEQQRRSGGPPPPPDLKPEQGEADLNDAAADSEAVERFDQQGALPWSGLDPALGLSDTPALGGEQAMGPGMAIMEQRLEQIEGDPSLLMRNQFIIEEMRQMRESGGQLQESRPW